MGILAEPGIAAYAAAMGEAGTADMQAQRSMRRRGAVLVFLGAFLAGFGAWLLWWMAPKLSHPGVEVGGSTFNGTAQEAMGVLALLGAVGLFGAIAFFYGLWQVRTGRKNLAVVAVMVGIAVLLFGGGLLFTSGG
jgi:uncharacterized membrane protein